LFNNEHDYHQRKMIMQNKSDKEIEEYLG